MKIKRGLFNMLARIVSFTLIMALLCQDMAMALPPRSIFEAPTATKVGKDQSPVPEGVVTEFIQWVLTQGAVIEDGENGLRVLKRLEYIKLEGFKKDGYTVYWNGSALVFTYNIEEKSSAYVLRDNEGNRYVTDVFYEHYRVRQIIKKLQLQLLVFDDLDDVDLELVEPYESPKDIQKLSSRLGMDSFTDGKTEDLGRFFISRKELLKLLRSIIEDTNVAGTCADIIRLFIIKNQMPDVDIYRIIAEMAQQLIDATEPDEVTLLCFKECIGEMRIRLLRESQMGSPEKNLRPYTENAITDLERRFSDEYNPPDEFPYFPITDNAWLSRDEIIRLGLTLDTNPKAKELLDRFIEAQLEMYPDSGVEEVVKELTRIEIQPDSPGLIGKYVLTSGVHFVEEGGKGYVLFRAYKIGSPKNELIKIEARRVPTLIFNNFRNTGIPEIDTALRNFLSNFKGEVFILASNPYGIDGIGTKDTLAVLESLKDNDIALFHELAHAAGVDVTKYINADLEALGLYLRSTGKGVPQMRQHYALRLFQRQRWEVDDKKLTRLINIDRLKTERDSRKRIEFAKRLGLDTRPIESGLLDVQYVGHDMAVKEIVNPNNEHKIAVYACGGSDWSNFILCTNSDEAYFVDAKRPDAGKLQEILDRSWDTLNPSPYLSYKYRFGYIPSGEEGISEVESRILFELKLMGVKRDTITIISNQDSSFTINFEWAYHGQATKRYSITYIQADIARPKDYPNSLRKVLQKGIDIYYQKASIDLPGIYFEFMNVIVESVKEGGYILTDDIDFCVNRVDRVDLDALLNEYRELSFTKKGEVYSEELRHWEELIQSLDPVGGKNLYYGSYVNIRQKKKSDFRKDIEKDIELLKGLWLREFNENLTYEVKYDVSRLSGSQQDILRTYIDILGKKLNIEAKPFKGAERDYVIKVICKDDKGRVFGEGGVDVEGEGSLEDSPLRIIGMLNIAFAGSNIINEPRVDDPLIKFIQYQYKAITGKELSGDADIRRIILPLPEKIDIEEAERLNFLAKELLTSA